MTLPSAEELARKCALYDMDRAKYIAEIEHAFGLVLEAAAKALRDSCTFDDKPCPLCVANDEIILNLKEEPRLARGQTVQSLMDWDLMQEALRRVAKA